MRRKNPRFSITLSEFWFCVNNYFLNVIAKNGISSQERIILGYWPVKFFGGYAGDERFALVMDQFKSESTERDSLVGWCRFLLVLVDTIHSTDVDGRK
jgi:hypothetical protein